MISDDKIKQAAEKIITEYGCFTNDAIQDFARAIYAQGRADQLESDVTEIESMSQDCTRFDFAYAIRNNTGDVNES